VKGLVWLGLAASQVSLGLLLYLLRIWLLIQSNGLRAAGDGEHLAEIMANHIFVVIQAVLCYVLQILRPYFNPSKATSVGGFSMSRYFLYLLCLEFVFCL
jgi:hypothetical protein